MWRFFLRINKFFVRKRKKEPQYPSHLITSWSACELRSISALFRSLRLELLKGLVKQIYGKRTTEQDECQSRAKMF